jgi:hypothetical protein
MTRKGEATTPYTTTVTVARMTDIVKSSQSTRAAFTAAAQIEAAQMMRHFEVLPSRGAELWQLLGERPFVVVWIDGTSEGVEAFPHLEDAVERFALVCADLEERPVPEPPAKKRK